MLQRFFSRGVPERRVAEAVEHQSEMQSRELLRERSAVILDRLEKRKAEQKRQDVLAREKARCEAEAAAAAELDAAATASAPDASVASDTKPHDETAAIAGAPTDGSLDNVNDAAEMAHAAGGETAAIADPHHAEPHHAEPQDGEQQDSEPEDAGLPMEDDGPYYPDDPGWGAEPDVASDMPERRDETDAELERAAEAARARIAARLEQLRESSGATDEPDGRADLGAGAPPLSPDDTDDH